MLVKAEQVIFKALPWGELQAAMGRVWPEVQVRQQAGPLDTTAAILMVVEVARVAILERAAIKILLALAALVVVAVLEVALLLVETYINIEMVMAAVLGYLAKGVAEAQALMALAPPVVMEGQDLAEVELLMAEAAGPVGIPSLTHLLVAHIMFFTTVLRVVTARFVSFGRDLHDHSRQLTWRNDYGTLYSNP